MLRLIILENIAGECTAARQHFDIYVGLHIYIYDLVLQFFLPAAIILIFGLIIIESVCADIDDVGSFPEVCRRSRLSQLSTERQTATGDGISSSGRLVRTTGPVTAGCDVGSSGRTPLGKDVRERLDTGEGKSSVRQWTANSFRTDGRPCTVGGSLERRSFGTAGSRASSERDGVGGVSTTTGDECGSAARCVASDRRPSGNRTTCMLLGVSFTYVVTLLSISLPALIVQVAIANHPQLVLGHFERVNNVCAVNM